MEKKKKKAPEPLLYAKFRAKCVTYTNSFKTELLSPTYRWSNLPKVTVIKWQKEDFKRLILTTVFCIRYLLNT